MRKATNMDKKSDTTKGQNSRYYDFKTKTKNNYNKADNKGFVGRK